MSNGSDDTTSTVAADISALEGLDPETPVTLNRTAVVDGLLAEDDVDVMRGRERYHIEKEIAHGAMGRVLLAQDLDINRPVAVKVMRAGRNASPRARRRFVEEVQLAGQLAHPNIVPVHDVGVTDDGVGWYTMRYVEGSTLADVIHRLRAGDPLAHALYTPARRLQLFLNVLDAIGYAHARGIIHRDIKPSNILVGKYGEVFVTDWGVARRVGGQAITDPGLAPALEDPTTGGTSGGTGTRDGSVIGTPHYMSPEQARGENASVDQRSDVYSLAAVLYEFLSLYHYLHPLPMNAKTEDVLLAVQTHVSTLATRLGHPAQPLRVPMDIARMLVIGLAKVPAKRFQSVAEFRTAIMNIMDGNPRVQCPTTAFIWSLDGLKNVMARRPVIGWFFVAFVFSLAAWGGVDVVMRLAR
jgi:serine/threonine-protein kinase